METATPQKWRGLRSDTSRWLSCAPSNSSFASRSSLSTFFSDAKTSIFSVSMMQSRFSRTGVPSHHPLFSCCTSPNRPNSLSNLRPALAQSLHVDGRPNREGAQAKSSVYGSTRYPRTSRRCCTSGRSSLVNHITDWPRLKGRAMHL